MPLLRLTKTDPQNAAEVVTTDMALAFVNYDGIAYRFDWTGRSCLVPLDAIARAVNPNSRQAMLRSVWIACDAETNGFWVAGDSCSIVSSRLGARGTATDLSQTIFRLPIASPYDRIGLVIGAKASVYSIDILINSIDEGDWSFPETPVT